MKRLESPSTSRSSPSTLRLSANTPITPEQRLTLEHYDTLAAVDLNESDINFLLKNDDAGRLAFKTYGKTETEWRLFRRIMFRAQGDRTDAKRTNYVQCKACGKLLVAKLTGGSNPARHRKHCKQSSQLLAECNDEPVKKDKLTKEERNFGIIKTLRDLNKRKKEVVDSNETLPALVDQLITLGNSFQLLHNEGGKNGERRRGNGQSPSQGSSASNTEYEIPAMVAYKIRQTYIFMRILKTNKPVLCKANDEDFFPPNKINTTAADRASWTAGQIITAYFDFDQKETECVIEAVGDREAVQEYFQNVIVRESGKKRKTSDVSLLNGVGEDSNDLSPAVRQLIFPNGDSLQQNGQTDGDADWAMNNVSPPPVKKIRLDLSDLTNQQILRRFEALESRLKQVEIAQMESDVKEKTNKKSEANIRVQIGGEAFYLTKISTDYLRSEVEKQKDKLLVDDTLIINGRNLYLESLNLDFLLDFQNDTSSFALKVLSLLIDKQTFLAARMPSLTNGESDSASTPLINQEVVDTYRKLLNFMAGSVVCADSLQSWLNSIHSALSEAQQSKDLAYPEMNIEPIFSMSKAVNGNFEMEEDTAAKNELTD